MKELTRVQTSKLVGGTAQCNRLGRRMRKLLEKGNTNAGNRVALRYFNAGCVPK